MAPRRRRCQSSSDRRADEIGPERSITHSARCNSYNNLDNLMDVDEPQLFIKTADSKRFVLLKSQASCFNALQMMTRGCTTNVGSSSAGELIHLKSVNSSELIKVLDWTDMHCSKNHSYYDYEQQGYGKDSLSLNQQILSDTAKTFLAAMSEEEMLKVMHVANYLDVRCLFGVCCKTIGKRWEGKQVEELRRLYHIESDFSTDEEAAMKAEMKRIGLQ